MAEKMRDIACADAATYAAEAANAGANAAEASDTARAYAYAAKAATYAAKASDYAADASPYAAYLAYATAGNSIVDSCLRFLDDCLPKVETVAKKTVERFASFLRRHAPRPRKTERYLATCVYAKAASYAVVASLNAGLGKPKQVEDSGMRGST